MKKIAVYLYLGILILSVITVTGRMSSITTTNHVSTKTMSKSSSESTLSDISAKISGTDPRGCLTGRFFYKGLNDTPSDGFYNTLMIDIEVNITQTSPNGYYVLAELQENLFERRYFDTSDNQWYTEHGIHVHGNSTYLTPLLNATGLYNITVHFDCAQLRALKMTGPYRMDWVQLEEWGVSTVDEMNSYDQESPFLWIQQIPDIYSYNEPEETGFLTIHDAKLVGEFLEVDLSYQSFYSDFYYIRMVLRDSLGGIIAHFEQSFNQVPWNTMNNVTLQIPSVYLTAFKDFTDGLFSGNQMIYFEEVTVAELYNWNHGWRKTYNISYNSSPYSVNINVDSTSPITFMESGNRWDYGSMNINDFIQFISYPQNFYDVLYMDIERTEPPDLPYGLPEFEIKLVDGWGRHGDPWARNFVSWDDWDELTQIKHYIGHIGKYLGPWLFEVYYPDHDPSADSQDLAIEIIKIEEDTSAPSFSLITPKDGDHFSQYYGIPIKGTQSDDSYVLYYLILFNDESVFYIRRDPRHGKLPGDKVSFTFFPPINYTGKFRMTVRAMDLTRKTSDTEITVYIDAGTAPTPESTIEKGLEWLRTQQNTTDPYSWDYGSWHYYPGDGWGKEGMTALASLCFIQAGLSTDSVVEDAINFLRNQFHSDSDVPGKSIHRSSYETAMATISLIAYNATLPSYDSSLNSLIDDAVEWLVETQNDDTWLVEESDPWYGGWRYGDDHQSSDLSVSQWVILALASYGYDPESDLWDKVQTFVRRCRGGYKDDGPQSWEFDGGFTYTPSTEDWRDQGGSSYGSMTAAGIWGLYLSGSPPNDIDILSALDWIGSLSPEQLVGQNPHYGRDFEYYWYLSASKAFLMAGRPQDQWWYDNITYYLNTHMVAETSTAAYWDNARGQEPPVFATVQAILSQQVFHGEVPTHKLEVSLEAEDSGGIYFWNSTVTVGYNYTTGSAESSPGTTYSGLLADTQSVEVLSPSKGEYFVDIFPAAGRDRIVIPQNLILRARALTETGHILGYRTRVVNYQYGPGTQVLRFKIVLSTVSGIDIHILEANPPLFEQSVSIDEVICPTYVEPGDSVAVSVKMTNLGVGTINEVEFFSEEDLIETSSQPELSSWTEDSQVTVNFEYSTSGLPLGKKTIVIGLITNGIYPVLVHLELQLGNHAPEGTLNAISDPVSGTIKISWVASDDDDDFLEYNVILVKPDGSKDTLAAGLKASSYNFDTTAYTDGTGYQIIIEISDGIDITELKSDLFRIKNRESEPGITPSWSVLLTILSLGFVLLYLKKKK